MVGNAREYDGLLKSYNELDRRHEPSSPIRPESVLISDYKYEHAELLREYLNDNEYAEMPKELTEELM